MTCLFIGTVNHDLDCAAGASARHLERLEALLQLEAVRDQRLDVNLATGNHRKCHWVAATQNASVSRHTNYMYM